MIGLSLMKSERAKVDSVRNERLGRRRSGFTLVEALAALSILAIGLVGLLALTSAVLRQTGVVGDMNAACSLAHSKLSQLLVDKAFVEGTEEGDFDEDGMPGFRWQTDIKPYEEADGLYEVTVAVWRQGAKRRWSLTTLARGQEES